MKSYHALGLISFLVAYAVHLLISWNTETPVRLSSGGVCLDGGNMTAGARVDGDSSCLGPYHLWDISAYYGPTEIRLSSTDLCLTVSSNTSTLTDRNLTVSPCSGSPSQQWMTAGFLGTVFSHAGLCLTSTKGRTLPDSFASANARLAPCGAENQRWVARRRSYVTMDVGGSKMEE